MTYKLYITHLVHCIPTGSHGIWRTVFRQLHSPSVVLDLDPPTQLPMLSRAQELSLETADFTPLHLLHGTDSLPDELHRITDTDLFKPHLKTELFSITYCYSIPGRFCKWHYKNPLLLLFFKNLMDLSWKLECTGVSMSGLVSNHLRYWLIQKITKK